MKLLYLIVVETKLQKHIITLQKLLECTEKYDTMIKDNKKIKM